MSSTEPVQNPTSGLPDEKAYKTKCATGETFENGRFKESVLKDYENSDIDWLEFEKAVEHAFGEYGRIALEKCKKVMSKEKKKKSYRIYPEREKRFYR